jgi:DivIVA domain-containing protein
MALTPDDIEGREFTVVARGYDPDEVSRFLTEVAASYRYALHNLLPGVGSVATPVPAPDPFAELGEEVAEILRATERAAERRRAELDEELDAVRAEAEQLAARVRHEAERDRAQARRALARAQERADAIVAEAHEEGRRRAERIEAEARARADQLLERARQQERLLREAERATLERIATLRTELQAILDRTGAGAVLDLREHEPVVRTAGDPDAVRARLAERDPVAHMVQAAVGRAAEHSAGTEDPNGNGGGAAAGTTDGTGLRDRPGDHRPPS